MSEVSKRIQWTRERLGFDQSRVYRSLGIPQSTYHQMENNNCLRDFNRIYRVSEFFNTEWQRKFYAKQNYPRLNDYTVRKVTFTWVMLGVDPYAEAEAERIRSLQKELSRAEWFGVIDPISSP